MTDAPQFVEIFTANADQPETARKLLAAAGDAPEQVATVFGGFRVPVAIAEAAGFAATDTDAVDSEAVAGAALANTSAAGGVVDAPTGHGPASLPAKVDGGPEHLTGQTPPAAEPAEGDQGDQGVVETADGEQHTGVVPADAATDGEDDGELRGEALDDALRAAELPTTGKVAEKRARLAAHRANGV